MVCNHRKLKNVCKQLKEIQAEGGLLKYVTAGDEAAMLLGIVEEVHDAITCFRGRCKHSRYESSPSISQVNIIKLFLQSVAFIYYFLLNSFSHLYSFSTPSY